MDWRAWVSGGVAGVSMSVMGHPFDTIKTRMQTDPTHGSALRCASAMARSEGVLSLWKGLSPSVTAGVMTGSIRFGIQSWANKALARSLGVSDFESLGLTTRALSEAGGGIVAGVFLPILFTPLEMVKCRQQVHVHASTAGAGQKRTGTIHIIRDVLRTEGIRGMYVGHAMTTLRSTIGNASLFGSYVVAKDGLEKVYGKESAIVQPLSGIAAGWCSWLSMFPIDSIKTRMQVAEGQIIQHTGTSSTQASGAHADVSRIKGALQDMRGMKAHEALLQLWREGGMYRGVGPVLARAVPVHMAYLPVFDLVSTVLDEHTR